ncbi:MAG TPA: hypothetical protein VE009_09295 [Paenibacillus sp.]|nr:hypothetical protein [Paenibacillus sp.]
MPRIQWTYPTHPYDLSRKLKVEDYLLPKTKQERRGALRRMELELDKEALLSPLKRYKYNWDLRKVVALLLSEQVRIVATAGADTGRYVLARRKPKPEELWLPVPEAARHAGLTPAALYKRIQRGSVEARRDPMRGLCVDALRLRPL